MTPLARKRVKLLRKLEQQIEAAEAEARDEQFLEEISRWVRDEETGDKKLVTQQRPIRPWSWQNQHGAWMVSLRDGNKLIPLDGDNTSVEVGEKSEMVPALETLRDAVVAGELDAQLEAMIATRKPFGKRKEKAAPAKAS
ncbi:MAG: hypothetical protein ABJH63_15220 [Rhizobiaceae bacterium]